MSAKEKTTGFLAEFRKFIARGNVMDLAVGVIIGGAFKGITDSLVNDILNPVLGIFAGDNEACLLYTSQRANQEAMDKLEQTSDSATQSLENILQENETLKVENEALSQQVAQLQEALEDAESASDGEAALVQLEALCYLNQIRALYNDGRYSDARDAAAGACLLYSSRCV